MKKMRELLLEKDGKQRILEMGPGGQYHGDWQVKADSSYDGPVDAKMDSEKMNAYKAEMNAAKKAESDKRKVRETKRDQVKAYFEGLDPTKVAAMRSSERDNLLSQLAAFAKLAAERLD